MPQATHRRRRFATLDHACRHRRRRRHADVRGRTPGKERSRERRRISPIHRLRTTTDRKLHVHGQRRHGRQRRRNGIDHRRRGERRPVANAQAVTTAEDTALAITLTGTDTDGDPLTFAVGAPSNGTLSGAAPNLTYTPNANFNGTDSFTFTVNDGTASSAPATVSITVSAVNDPPILAAPPAPTTVPEDTATVVGQPRRNVQRCGSTDGDTLTLTVAGRIERGVVRFGADDQRRHADARHRARSERPCPPSRLQARDVAGATATGNVQLTVTPLNDAPTVSTPIPDQNPPEDSPPMVLDLGSHIRRRRHRTNGDVLTYSVATGKHAVHDGCDLRSEPHADVPAEHERRGAPDGAGAATVAGAMVSTIRSSSRSTRSTTCRSPPTTRATMDEDAGSIDIDVIANDTHGDDPTTHHQRRHHVTIGGVGYPNSSESTPTRCSIQPVRT